MSNQVARNSRSSYYVEDYHLYVDDSLTRWNDSAQRIENSAALVDDAGNLTVPSITSSISADPLFVDNIYEKTPANDIVVHNNLQIDPVAVIKSDKIEESTLNAGVTIENKFNITQNGTNMDICHSNVNVPNATLNVNEWITSKRDINVHLLSDTDGVATGDDPILYWWRDAQTRMMRQCICTVSGAAKLEICGDGTSPSYEIKTGGTYTAPVINADGCSLTVPTVSNLTNALVIDSTQNVNIENGDLTVGTSTLANEIMNVGSAGITQLNLFAEQDGDTGKNCFFSMTNSTLTNTQAMEMEFDANDNFVVTACKNGSGAGILLRANANTSNAGSFVGPSTSGAVDTLLLKQNQITAGAEDGNNKTMAVVGTESTYLVCEANSDNGAPLSQFPYVQLKTYNDAAEQRFGDNGVELSIYNKSSVDEHYWVGGCTNTRNGLGVANDLTGGTEYMRLNSNGLGILGGAQFDYDRDTAVSISITGAWSASIDFAFERVGLTCRMHLLTSLNTSVSASKLEAGVNSIPSQYRPTSNVVACISLSDNATISNGQINVLSSGAFNIGLDGLLPFTGSGTVGFYNQTITWSC